MKVAIAARTPFTEKPLLKALVDEYGVSFHQCDATDPSAVKSLFERVTKDLGRFPDLVLYNPSGNQRGPVETLDPEAVKRGIMVTTFGAFLVAQQAAIGMIPRGSGSILFTGASAGCSPSTGADAWEGWRSNAPLPLMGLVVSR